MDNLTAYSRFKNKELLGNSKADFWVCSRNESLKDLKRAVCCDCNQVIYYKDRKEIMGDLMKENIKKICIDCILKYDDLPKKQREAIIKIKEVIRK